ncbi:unnamed protein product [Gordionus sp. m RMFG-2023]|uniref:uncharacterized protein LOC135923541 n=1 Tax=Gordionus sp. m RMFG-2023 TaxID=3053472 RepID=UPI0030E41AC0
MTSNSVMLHCCPYLLCPSVFKRPYRLSAHINSQHLKFRAFPCIEASCDKAFYRKEHLRRHTLRTHKKMLQSSPGTKYEDLGDSEGDPIETSSITQNNMETCSNFENSDQSTNLLCTALDSKSPRLRCEFKCPNCPKTYKKRERLKTHLLSHQDSNISTSNLVTTTLPYLCTHYGCPRSSPGKGFASASRLRRHIPIHNTKALASRGTRVLPHRCPYSSTCLSRRVTFRSAKLLSQHLEIFHKPGTKRNETEEGLLVNHMKNGSNLENRDNDDAENGEATINGFQDIDRSRNNMEAGTAKSREGLNNLQEEALKTSSNTQTNVEIYSNFKHFDQSKLLCPPASFSKSAHLYREFKCPDCSKTFKKRGQLETHSITHQTDTSNMSTNLINTKTHISPNTSLNDCPTYIPGDYRLPRDDPICGTIASPSRFRSSPHRCPYSSICLAGQVTFRSAKLLARHLEIFHKSTIEKNAEINHIKNLTANLKDAENGDALMNDSSPEIEFMGNGAEEDFITPERDGKIGQNSPTNKLGDKAKYDLIEIQRFYCPSPNCGKYYLHSRNVTRHLKDGCPFAVKDVSSDHPMATEPPKS